MKIIVALNYEHFRAWCLDNNRHHRDRDLMFISTSAYNFLKGLRGRQLKGEDEVVFYGPFYDGSYATEVTEIVEWLESNRKRL